MPSVDELLNMAEVAEVTFTETNDKIEIDADTRTMIIPDTERIFGVMSDEKGERKYFRCKRFVGNGIDLSKLDLRVIYQNASGLESGKDKYIVTDLKTDGEVEWVEVGQPTDEQTNSAVKSWLNEHPEATTTVQDGSIEEIKINKNFLPYIKNDYFTPQMFGAKGDGVADDTESLKEALKHKCVFIPSGTYIISSMLEVKGHVTITYPIKS